MREIVYEKVDAHSDPETFMLNEFLSPLVKLLVLLASQQLVFTVHCCNSFFFF